MPYYHVVGQRWRDFSLLKISLRLSTGFLFVSNLFLLNGIEYSEIAFPLGL